MLRRGHEPPANAEEVCRNRGEITGRDDEEAARGEMSSAQREGPVRTFQVLDDIEQHDDVHRAYLGKIARIGGAGEHANALLPAKGGGLLGDLDSGHVEEAAGFLQEEAVGAAKLGQPPAGAVPADEAYGVGKF